MNNFPALDLLYCRALEAMNRALQTGRLEVYEYRYLLLSFRTAQHPVAFRALCADLINQFGRPITAA